MADVSVRKGDCLEVLKMLENASVDSCVTDPPYHLSVIKHGSLFPGQRAAIKAGAQRGFMGKTWDGGDIAFRPELWAEVLRVLKPGGHLVAFSGTRTYHRMACAIEDAGFEVRDMIAWCYGSGFPKSLDVSKAIDKAAGATRDTVGVKKAGMGSGKTFGMLQAEGRNDEAEQNIPVTAPATDAARQWQGWGTALKPSLEPICLARKPLIGTVAANVLAHETGALNIDGCRIGTEGGTRKKDPTKHASVTTYGDGLNGGGVEPIDAGRWPANLAHDGSDEVLAVFPSVHSAGAQSAGGWDYGNPEGTSYKHGGTGFRVGDASGSAARFFKTAEWKDTDLRLFYTAKADAPERHGSKHPTVKPVDLMCWLCRLITPPGGLILDPFAGTGTTGLAAVLEGFRAVLIEREDEYYADIRRRFEDPVNLFMQTAEVEFR
jgi:site-specific DNA-methyltransferase (adenine-specific)